MKTVDEIKFSFIVVRIITRKCLLRSVIASTFLEIQTLYNGIFCQDNVELAHGLWRTDHAVLVN